MNFLNLPLSWLSHLSDPFTLPDQALEHHIRVINYPTVNAVDYDWLCKWLQTADCGSSFPKDLESGLYDDKHENDLISLMVHRRETDLITTYIDKTLIPWLYRHICYPIRRRRKRQRDPEADKAHPVLGSIDYRSSQVVSRFVTVFLLLLACGLTTVPVVVLDFVHSTSSRMAILVSMTLIFSTALVVFVRPSRSDVWTAALAITALQAVYLGGSNCSCVAR